jgi:hypothetical protein
MIALVADFDATLVLRRRQPVLAEVVAAAPSVGASVVVSPASAGWIGAATTTPVSGTTAYSHL